MLKKTLRVLFVAAALVVAAPAHADKLSESAKSLARANGEVRVLVMLHSAAERPPGTRQGVLRGAKAARAAVDGLLSDLPATEIRVRRRFFAVPAVSMTANPAALERLRRHPSVMRVDVDEGGTGGAVAPDEASVINRVSELVGLGFDGAGMKVAVIDSGVDRAHRDLGPRLVAEHCFCSSPGGVGGCCPNGQATQSGAGSAQDDHGHGTNVAGIVVGQGLVAPRGAVPGAQLVAIKVLDRNNSFCCTSDVVAAMDWLVQFHPDVDAVNLSLGTNSLFAGDCDGATAFTQALSSAVNALIASGAVVTVSTGNQGNPNATSAPSCIRNALGVAATWDFSGGAVTFLGCTEASTSPRQPTCFSNRSATTDLYGAGAFVRSAGLGGGTSNYGGTSQAAPMASACVVALKQAVPLSTVDQRMDAMKLSLTRVQDAASGRVYPMLDCIDALRLLEPSIFDPIAAQCSGAPVPPSLALAPAAELSSPVARPPVVGSSTHGKGSGVSTAAAQPGRHKGDAGR